MVTNQFAAILKDLEPYFKCKLEPDSSNSCLIKFKTGLNVQIEPKGAEELLIVVRLGTLPPSTYQDKVFRAALRSNDMQPPSQGMFGWSKKSGQLIYFIIQDLRYFSIDKCTQLLTPFLEKAKLWSETLAGGNVPNVEEQITSGPKPNLFGLIK